METAGQPTSKIIKYGGGFIGVAICLGLIGMIFIDKPKDTAAAVHTTAPTPPPTTKPQLQGPDFQMAFMAVIDSSRAKYQATDNELTRSALVTDRFSQFEKLKGDPRKITNWVGQLRTIGTSGDGKAWVTISLGPNLTFVTSNADIIDTEHTLIPQSSAIYKKLESMKPGDPVKFSGRLMRPINLTEAGKMVDPRFLFAFTDITKI
jgi:hypothetical protein